MFGVKKELKAIREELMGISLRLYETKLVNEQLEEMNRRLLEERKELLDRVMSVNYEKYQLYSLGAGEGSPGVGLGLDQLEEMAGESFSLEGDKEE